MQENSIDRSAYTASAMKEDHNQSYDSVIKQYNEAMHKIDERSKSYRQDAKLQIYANPSYETYARRDRLME